MALTLDAIDWRILRELQLDGRITNIALAIKIGLSAPPCLRRVRTLEEAGLISGYTAILDEDALGFLLTAFAILTSSPNRNWEIKWSCCRACQPTSFLSFYAVLTGQTVRQRLLSAFWRK